LEETSNASSSSTLSWETVLAGFQGKLKWHGTSFFYQIGLLLVTALIVLLPLLYIAFIGATAWGVYWWGRNFVFLLGGDFHGVHLYLAKVLLYCTPLFAGIVVVFFMLKPLLARPAPGTQPLALNPANEPLLFAFISRICETIGAPFPKRIDVDCDLNASAGFRRGFRSFFGNDLVLTIGLPLVAAMSVTELAGIVAHEFGHFTQGLAMRLSYIIRRVNGWFARFDIIVAWQIRPPLPKRTSCPRLWRPTSLDSIPSLHGPSWSYFFRTEPTSEFVNYSRRTTKERWRRPNERS
jgi:hypothetical protein